MATPEAVSRQARQLKSDPSAAPHFGSFEKIHQHLNEESYRAFQNQRRELYALLAVITDRVIDNAITAEDEHPLFGLVAPVGGEPEEVGAFANFKFGLNATLLRSCRSIAGEPDIAPVVGRLEDVLPVFLGGEGDFRYQTADALMKSGIGTASKITIDSMVAVAQLAKTEQAALGPQELAAIARKSSGVVQKVAAVGINQLTPAEVLILIAKSGRQDSDILTLKTSTAGHKYVDFVKPIASMPSPFSRSQNGLTVGDLKGQNDVLGCPALIRFQGDNGLEKLWQWVVDIGEKNGFFASICSPNSPDPFI